MWAPVDILSDDEGGGKNNKEEQKSASDVLAAAKAAVESKIELDKTKRNKEKASSKAKAKSTVKSAASKKAAAKKAASKRKGAEDQDADKQETADTEDEPKQVKPGSDDELPIIKRPASCTPKAKGGATMKRPASRATPKCETKTRVYKYLYHKHNKYGFKKNKQEIMTVGVAFWTIFFAIFETICNSDSSSSVCFATFSQSHIHPPVRSKTLIRKFLLKDLLRLQLAAKIETFFGKPFQN